MIFVSAQVETGSRTVDQDTREEMHRTLTLCAKALATNAEEDIQALEKNIESPASEEVKSVMSYLEAVRSASLAWLDAINSKEPTKKEDRLKNVVKRYSMWVLSAFKSHVRLVMMPFDLLHPKKWAFYPLWFSVKRTVGYLIMFIMAVYWPAYANFSLRLAPNNINPIYSGWQILAYSLAWTPTMEGTVKIAFQRELATILGCGLAWIGAIICRWSYEDGPPLNPYGVVVYMTVLTAIVAYFSYNPGLASMLGAQAQWGKTGFLTIVFMDLIIMQVFYGQGSNNELTLNRIVATFTGVLLSAILGVIPPFIRGGDEKHTMEYKEALTETYRSILTALSGEASGDDPLS
jgi:hypothetical protein